MRHRSIGRLLIVAFAATAAVTGALAQQARMFGTVTDESGTGVANAKVILDPVDRGARAEIVTKNQKGSYLIGIIRPGRYALKVEAEGLALVSVRAEAMGLNAYQKKESKWKLDGRVRPDKPTELNVEDGMEITCDLVLGKATEVTTATGEKATASVDQAYGLLRQQVRKGDCAGALPQIEKFTVDNPTHAEAFYLKGYCDAVLGKDDDALAALTKSKELDPVYVGTSTLIGKIQARDKHLPEAEAAFQKELEGTTVPSEAQLDVLLSLGAVQRDQSKNDAAIATFEKAVTVAPNRPEAYAELSALYSKTGQTEKAAQVLEKAKTAGADDPVALLNVGISYFNKKDYPHAEATFRQVTESKAGNSDLAMAWALLGRLQMRDGKNPDAIASFKKSIALDPKGRLASESQEALNALQAPKKK